MKKIKTILASCLLVVSVVSINPIKVNASTKWIKDNTGWWYQTDSTWAVGWKLIDGKWYYFGQDGYMLSSCYIGECYLGADGAWMEPSAQEKTSDPNKVLSSGLTLFEAGQQIKALVNNLQSMGESIDSNMDYINTRCEKLGTTYEEISKLPVDVMNQTASGGTYEFNGAGSAPTTPSTPSQAKPSNGKVSIYDVAGKGPAKWDSTGGGTTAIDKDFDNMIKNANK